MCINIGREMIEDSYLTLEFIKPYDYPPKCALCFGNHPSNFRGCNVYRELQNRKKLNNLIRYSNYIFTDFGMKSYFSNYKISPFLSISITYMSYLISHCFQLRFETAVSEIGQIFAAIP